MDGKSKCYDVVLYTSFMPPLHILVEVGAIDLHPPRRSSSNPLGYKPKECVDAIYSTIIIHTMYGGVTV